MICRDAKLELVSAEVRPRETPFPRRTLLLEEDAVSMGFSKPKRPSGGVIFAWAPPKSGGSP